MAPPIIYLRNDALENNPPAGDQFLTVNGSNWLYTVTAIYGFSLLTLFGLTSIARSGERFFHYLFIIANFAGLLAYYAQASDLSWVLVATSNQITSGTTRQIFWAKYVQWVVTFPAAILSLGVLSGISWTTILYHIALSWVWVLSYLVASLTATNYKWGFFAFGTMAYFALALSTLLPSRSAAARVGVVRDYTLLVGWVNLLWILYPIAWGISDGGNRIGLTASFIFFGILDVLLVPVLSFAVVVLARNWDYHRLNIAFTQYGRVPAAAGTFPEKEAAPATTAGGVVGESAV